jgi:hypothetical protein
MVFSVLIPMVVGPMIGNAINASQGIRLGDLNSPDVMTTEYIPAREIFLVASIATLFIYIVLPFLQKQIKKAKASEVENGAQE